MAGVAMHMNPEYRNDTLESGKRPKKVCVPPPTFGHAGGGAAGGAGTPSAWFGDWFSPSSWYGWWMRRGGRGGGGGAPAPNAEKAEPKETVGLVGRTINGQIRLFDTKTNQEVFDVQAHQDQARAEGRLK